MAQQWQQGQPGYQQYSTQAAMPPNFQQQQGFGSGIQPQPTGFPQQRTGGFQPQQIGFPQTGFQQLQQPGFQQPQQPGFQQPQQPGFQQPQQTGFQQPQQPQQPGFLGGSLGYQQTGFQGGSSGFQHRAPPPPPPVPQIPSRFQGQPQSQLQPQPLQSNPAHLVGNLQQQPSLLSPSPGPGLVPQQTGFSGGGGLVPQMTGFVDPRLQMMGSTFMPANLSAPYAPSGVPQFASAPQQQQGLSLQQSFQQHNQAQRGSAAPRVPWALSKAERKQYDQIFRAWDTQGTGFISGETALQVFGQSGLEKNDMARIWSLADQDDRGKLNLAEFHVAMGLIYRRLNGNDIPDQLPSELVPPSSRDLDSSVDFVKGLLANDGHTRVTNDLNEPASRLPVRSFNGSVSDSANTRKDGTIYRHREDEVSSYKPSNRHFDRRTVRTGNESPSADLNEMRRQLENTSKLLEKASAESASRTAEDEALEKEMEDLRYRVRRVQDDLDYVSRGPRSFSKDEERRKLERDLLHLMHERLPEVERKIEERDRRKAREKEDWVQSRDRANDKFSRFDDGYSSKRDRYRYDDDGRGYNRGTFDRDNRRLHSRNDDSDRDYERRDRNYGRDSPYGRDRGHDSTRDLSRDSRPRSPPASARSPPPPPPPPPPVAALKSVPTPPAPTRSPAPNLKSMTPEERTAFIRADAQRRVQERMRALGVASPSSTPTVDSSVEDRLATDRREAEEKARQAEKDAEERERLRKERLESAKAFKDGKDKPAASSAPAPPASKAKTPAPPPPRRAAPPRASATRAPAPAPARMPVPVPPPAPPAVPEVDPEEERLRAREEALKKERDARAARLRELEEQEREQQLQEEQYQARRQAFLDAKASATRGPAPPPPPTRPMAAAAPASAFKAVNPAPAPPPPVPVEVVVSPRPAPPAPTPPPPQPALSVAPVLSLATSSVTPPAATPSPSAQSATNPFNRLKNQGTVASPAPPMNTGGNNPFFRPQPSATSTTPPPVKSTYITAPTDSDEEWDDLKEMEGDDSSDDEYKKSRGTRDMLAQKIFGGMMPSRGQSPATPPTDTPAPPATSLPPPPPPAPPAPPAPGSPPAPVPPPAPAPPPPPALAQGGTPPIAAGLGRGALLSQIAGGARLRKTVTNDRSKAAVSGNVLGDIAPPSHISMEPRPSSPPSPTRLAQMLVPDSIATDSTDMSRHSSRQSVDWYADLAADGSAPPQLPTTVEEEEPQTPGPVPDIRIDASATVPVTEAAKDPLEDVDQGTEYRVRSLYPYEVQRAGDLSFAENLVIKAHPSKTGGDWWYGTLVKEGKSGFFPSTYVQQLEDVKAKALYPYTGGNADELPFTEGAELTIIDRSEEDWWKTEQDGVIFIVPAAYLEVIVDGSAVSVKPPLHSTAPKQNDSSPAPLTIAQEVNGDNDDDSDEFHSFEGDSESSESETEASEQEQSDSQWQEEYEARELERQRVLAAAGLIVKNETRSPPRPPARTRSLRTRRPAPATPTRPSPTCQISVDRDLPPVPSDETPPPPESVLHVDDAFDRYEAYKQYQGHRASIASSYDTAPPSPSTTSLALSPTLSREESRSHGYSGLLNFLGRRTPGSESRSAISGLSISGPIISGPIPSSREGSPAFGSSWSSLVDKAALDGILPEERRRQEAIFELIATESAYVRDLQLIVETFYSSMMPLLDRKAITVIFANIEDILLTNTTFFSSLEVRQKDCRLYIDNVGDLIDANMARMGVYMQYCVNTGAAIKILQSLRDSKPELAAHLQRLRDDPAVRGLDLSSYLLTPMQRITRYPLLIRQILSQTNHQPERRLLEGSIAEVERVLESINESIRDQEGQDRLRQISQTLWIDQGRLDLTAPTRYMGQRKLLKEGPLSKTKSGRKLHGFLCSDILVVTEEAGRALYRMPIPLSELQVREAPGKSNDLDFQISLAFPRGGGVINLRATSARDAQNWMRTIEQARVKCIAAESRAARRAPGSMG